MREYTPYICQLIYKDIQSKQPIYRSVLFTIEAAAESSAYQNALITASRLLLLNPILQQHTFVGIALLEIDTNDHQSQQIQFKIHPETSIHEQRIREYQDDLIKNLGYCA